MKHCSEATSRLNQGSVRRRNDRTPRSFQFGKVLAVAALLAMSFAIINQANAQEPRKTKPGPPFMRAKLGYSQRILEGLVLGQYDLVSTNAAALRSMSLTNAFVILGNPLYGREITNFQSEVTLLLKAAEKQDLPRATESYAHVTAACVSCHDKFRREQTVRGLKTGLGH